MTARWVRVGGTGRLSAWWYCGVFEIVPILVATDVVKYELSREARAIGVFDTLASAKAAAAASAKAAVRE